MQELREPSRKKQSQVAPCETRFKRRESAMLKRLFEDCTSLSEASFFHFSTFYFEREYRRKECLKQRKTLLCRNFSAARAKLQVLDGCSRNRNARFMKKCSRNREIFSECGGYEDNSRRSGIEIFLDASFLPYAGRENLKYSEVRDKRDSRP